MKILVTGSSGRIGGAIVRDLLAAGHEVTGTDSRPSADAECPFVAADLRDLGQTMGLLAGKDAVAHMAAIPAPGGQPDDVVFDTNVRTTFNVLHAAALLGLRRVVSASSISAYGTAYAFHEITPLHVPFDEEHPLLHQDVYGLSKEVGEDIAATMHRRTGMAVANMRFAMVMTPQAYAGFSGSSGRSEEHDRRVLWCYIDVRDAARACRLALELAPEIVGCQAFNITAPDTFMAEPTAHLVRRSWPHPPEVDGDDAGTWAPIDCTRAQRVLGFTPQYLWEQHAPKVRGQAGGA